MDINDDALHAILESNVKINSITKNANNNFSFQLEGGKSGLLRVLDILLEEGEDFLNQLVPSTTNEFYDILPIIGGQYKVYGKTSLTTWRVGTYQECVEWING